MKNVYLLVAVLGALLLAVTGCAKYPADALTKAEQAVTKAEAAGAAGKCPDHYGAAEAKLVEAKQLADMKKYGEATTAADETVRLAAVAEKQALLQPSTVETVPIATPAVPQAVPLAYEQMAKMATPAEVPTAADFGLIDSAAPVPAAPPAPVEEAAPESESEPVVPTRPLVHLVELEGFLAGVTLQRVSKSCGQGEEYLTYQNPNINNSGIGIRLVYISSGSTVWQPGGYDGVRLTWGQEFGWGQVVEYTFASGSQIGDREEEDHVVNLLYGAHRPAVTDKEDLRVLGEILDRLRLEYGMGGSCSKEIVIF